MAHEQIPPQFQRIPTWGERTRIAADKIKQAKVDFPRGREGNTPFGLEPTGRPPQTRTSPASPLPTWEERTERAAQTIEQQKQQAEDTAAQRKADLDRRLEEIRQTSPSGTLPERINRTLATSTSGVARFATSPEELAIYLETLPLPAHATIQNLQARIENDQLIANGDIKMAGGSSSFAVALATTPDGQLNVVSHAINPALRHRPIIGQVEQRLTTINRELTNLINGQIDPGWEVKNFQIAQDKLAFGFQRKQPTQRAPIETDETIAPIEPTSAQLNAVLQTMRREFHDMHVTGEVDWLNEQFITSDKFVWEEVGYGPKPIADSPFRGYLMIEPEDFSSALIILDEVGRTRKAQGQTMDFKWLTMTYPPTSGWTDDQRAQFINDPANIGRYGELGATDPRIVLYADRPEEIQELLTILANDPEWELIEQTRIAKSGGQPQNSPRRPGTNAFVYGGREYRSLNFNDKPGLSEGEAADPDWRDRKAGLRTVPL